MRYGGGQGYGTGRYYGAGEAEATARRRGITSRIEFEAPVVARRGITSRLEFEAPDTVRRGITSRLEFQAPAASRRGITNRIEFEAPPFERRGISSRIEFQVPRESRRGITSRIEFEAADAVRRGITSRIEFEVALASRRGITSRIEFEAAPFNRRGLTSRIEFRAPSVRESGTGGGTGGGAGDINNPVEFLADFQRLLKLMRATAPSVPRGMQSWSHTGMGQFRATTAAGRMWEESYIPARVSSSDFWAFHSYVNDLFQNERIFTINYPPRTGHIGTAFGILAVVGPNQTGSSIVTGGSATGTLPRGAIVQFADIARTFELLADAVLPDGPLVISPSIKAGGSPGDGQNVRYGATVEYRVKIDEIPELPEAIPGGGGSAHNAIYMGYRIRFREVP